jgi:hypothetical protein
MSTIADKGERENCLGSGSRIAAEVLGVREKSACVRLDKWREKWQTKKSF